MTRVALLWHMHQPYYEDLVTGEHMLPWVRLHALKDYFGMVALTKEFPDLRLTINLVPSLLVQIEAFAANRARDRVLDVGLKPAEQLTHADRAFMLREFFHAHRDRMIGAHARYVELLTKRGDVSSETAMAETASRFSVEELRDLQVWQKLVWIDPFYLEGDDRVRGLLEKGRSFTEDDKHTLRQVELEILNAVIPAHREAAATGRIELSTSPFYHPILPLLCDTEIYKHTHPDAPSPRRPFSHPEDAFEQLRSAVSCFERLFGLKPAGLWPSEGAVSPAMVPLVAEAGFSWMATDEMILARSLNTNFSRDAGGHIDQPERLYRPYAVTSGGTRVSCAFRDHALSDLIGFVYAGWDADVAADDFVGRVASAGRRFSERTGGEEAFIPVILDGENAWEHFPGGGRPFLRALYQRLSANPEIRTVTMAEGCQAAREELPRIFPGSWIDANFYIWIGHADDRKAWSQLADAREVLETSHDVPAETLWQARQEMFIAEGSDWFWWYGDDHSSDHDLEFDELFRRHLRNVYRLLNRTPPDELQRSNRSTGVTSPAVIEPTARITPTIDGEVTSYFEWLGAGQLDVRETAGAMHQIERHSALIRSIAFGFDTERLYVRVDAVRPMTDLLNEGLSVVIRVLEPFSLELVVSRTAGGVTTVVRAGTSPAALVKVAASGVLEVGIPFTALGLGGQPTGLISFLVAAERAGEEIERHPPQQPLAVALTDLEFDALHWRA